MVCPLCQAEGAVYNDGGTPRARTGKITFHNTGKSRHSPFCGDCHVAMALITDTEVEF